MLNRFTAIVRRRPRPTLLTSAVIVTLGGLAVLTRTHRVQVSRFNREEGGLR